MKYYFSHLITITYIAERFIFKGVNLNLLVRIEVSSELFYNKNFTVIIMITVKLLLLFLQDDTFITMVYRWMFKIADEVLQCSWYSIRWRNFLQPGVMEYSRMMLERLQSFIRQLPHVTSAMNVNATLWSERPRFSSKTFIPITQWQLAYGKSHEMPHRHVAAPLSSSFFCRALSVLFILLPIPNLRTPKIRPYIQFESPEHISKRKRTAGNRRH